MSDKPFISVMILSYNYGEMLKKALKACEEQTFSDFEVIMINNGSTDNTEEVFLKFQAENPSIFSTYVLINPNRGPINAWNEALKHVNGTYVMFHDADDWMEPDCLEKLAEKALETGADRVTGRYQEVATDGTVHRVRKFAKNPPKFLTCMLQGVIFRYSILCKNVFPLQEDVRYTYDQWITAVFAAYEDSSAIVDEVLYNYYFNSTSVMASTVGLKRIEAVHSELILGLSNAVKRTEDAKLRLEIEYYLLRVVYSNILTSYLKYSYQEATQIYRFTRDNLKKVFPHYQKNRLIWPFKNGYEFPGSFACAVLCLLDRLHMMWLIALPAKALRGSKMFRA